MALSTNFNVNPYYDDLDEDKKFLRLLYKPGYAVQARELTQAQSLIQKQIERFGNHIFKNGSVVTGGQVFLQDATYINLAPQYASTDIKITDFTDKIITSSDVNNSKRGQILKEIDATTSTPHTLLISQIYGANFTSGEEILTVEEGGPAFAFHANIASSGVGTGQVFSVNSGVYYYEGFFVKVDAQTIATSVYNNNTANARIGFEVVESIVESVNDTSLLDPAQGASNFQAPGSDRFKIELKLGIRSLDSTDLTKFIELAQVKEGILQKINRIPIYAELEETLARRTYDESGDYVVNPFLIDLKTNSANSANLDIIMSHGKAYVKGYEFTAIAPTKITIPKPRDTLSVPLKRVTADYGNFIYTTNHYGQLPAQVIGQVDIHCVPNASVWTANTATYSNTKIGTARVTRVAFDTNSGSPTLPSTYIYKTYLTDVNVGSIVVKATGTLNTSFIQLHNNMSNLPDAYKGAKIRIISGAGAGEYPRTITDYYASATTNHLKVSPAFITAPDSTSVCSIDFEIKDAECFYEPVSAGSTTRLSTADISSFSKDSSSTYQNVFISEKEGQPLIIKIGEDYVVQNSISTGAGGTFSYEYQKFIQPTFSGGIVDISSLIPGETLSIGSSTTSKQENISVKLSDGRTVPATDISVSLTTITLSGIGASYSGQANVFVTVNSKAGPKKKYYANANVQIQPQQSPYNIFANNDVYVFPDSGQTIINQRLVNRLPGVQQSLFVSDVVGINAIFDCNGTWPITDATLTSAANVTSRYILESGQKDTYYDHSSIILKAGETPPTGPLVVRYDRYKQESITPGYFTVDSYLAGHNNNVPGNPVTYETLPIYNTTSSPTAIGGNYILRDYFDFRPVRLDASGSDRNNLANTKSFGTPLVIPQNGTDITVEHQNYLPRVDKVVITKSRTFEIIRGASASKPAIPSDKEDSMTLYILTYPPFVEDPKYIRVTPVRNKRYTMKDIGVMEKRLENLEYYTSLSLLEFDTASKQDFTILDSANLPRFKNGFIVDAFNGTSVSEVRDVDYKASIDRFKKQLRPTYDLTSVQLVYDPDDGDNTNINRKGPLFTVDYTEVSYISQPLASRTENINPFNIVNYLGTIKLDPPSDVWYDETRQADLTVDLSGDRAAWNLLVEGAAKTEWGEWFQVSSSSTESNIGAAEGVAGQWKNVAGTTQRGIIVLTPQAVVVGGVRTVFPPFPINEPPAGWTVHSSGGSSVWQPIQYWITQGGANALPKAQCSARTVNSIEQVRDVNVVTTTVTGEARTGVKSTVTLDTITRSLGERVIDLSIVPYMREKNILYIGQSFKPSTQLYAFFDNENITSVCSRANKVVFKANNLSYQTELGNPEVVNIKNNVTGTTNGTSVIVMTSNNIGYIVSTVLTNSIDTPQSGATLSVIGQSSSTNTVVDYFEHYTGQPTASGETTLQLSLMATGARNCSSANLVGQPIYIVKGLGLGEEKIITAYDSSTRTITVNTAWNIRPSIDSIYTIGRNTTDLSGACAGIFFLPGSTFRVGEKLFRLIDDSSGNIESSRTNGDARFFAQGLMATTQETNIIATVPAGIQRTDVRDSRTTTTTSVRQETQTRTAFYSDPLAQTFLVGEGQYPNGLFISRVRVCFATKDPTVPVRLEIRPTVNGYPHSSVVYPLGTVVLTPDKVKTTTKPDITNEANYTDFVFDSPIYLQPGEHCFVLLANSKLYNVYVAEKSKKDLTSQKDISDQPYLGSLFLSQNGSTWTADQNVDMQFQIFRNSYSTETSQVVFKPDMTNISSNVVFDVAHLMSTDISLPRTTVSYVFDSEKSPNGGMSGLKTIVPNLDYDLNDSLGRRVLNPDTGKDTFKVIVSLTSGDSALTPYVDSTRLNLLAIENKINNLPLSNDAIVIANTGTAGSMANGIFVVDHSTDSLGNTLGSGAIIKVETSDGKISRAWISNPGSGYANTPTINLFNATAESATMGTGLTPYTGKLVVNQSLANSVATSIILNGETSASGGNANARYIMRTVTLADGFDSGDLRVYLTAYKPITSQIYVYYKILSISDPTPFYQRNWQLMTQINNFNFNSSFTGDFRELVFAPGINGVANNFVNYTSNGTAFGNFKTFAIKIVMAGTDATNVPLLKDLRVIALPEGS
jgi:hypothetical protein